MSPESPDTKTPSQRIYGTLRHIAVELPIVFIGVYLAFQLNEYSGDRAADERRDQLRSALAAEIDVFLLGADHILPRMDTAYAQWRREYDAGRRPDPLHFELGGVNLPPRGMWQAVLASDGLTLLSVETMQKLSDFYNAMDILLTNYAGNVEFGEREIIPNDGPGAFYSPGKQTLQRKYAAYMRRIQDMLRLFEVVRKKARESKGILVEGE